MDEMKIATGFMQKMVANVVTKVIKKKLGLEPTLRFNDPIRLTNDDQKIKLHLNLDAELSKEELSILLAGLL